MIKYLNLVLFIGMVYVNYLANALPINNKTTGQLSDALPNLFVPSGITFSIWGIIYLLLASYCIVQFRVVTYPAAESVGKLFAVTCILNALWIVCWHYEKLGLSVLVMLGMLVSLIIINSLTSSLPFGIIKASFGVYLGWICIATIANITAVLVSYNWKGFGISGEAWAIIMIVAGSIIAAAAIYKFRNPFTGLAVIWAFAGIILKRYPDVQIIALGASIALVFVGIITVLAFTGRLFPVSE